MKTDDSMQYSHRKLGVSYCQDVDTLEVYNGDQVHYRYAVADCLTANLDADREVSGFTLEKARTLLLPHLNKYKAEIARSRLNYQPVIFSEDAYDPGERKMLGRNTNSKLRVGYFQEYDILDIWNEEGASFGWDVGVNLLAFSVDEDGQEIKGFTLECAAQLLLPCFRKTPLESDTTSIGG
jgi:uncharacterized protein YuzE